MIDRAVLRASWHAWVINDFRSSGPWWLQVVWTVGVCITIAVGLTVLGFVAFARGDGWSRGFASTLEGGWYWFRINLWMALVIGFIIHGLFVAAAWAFGAARLGALRGVRRLALNIGLPLVGMLLGWPLGAWLLQDRLRPAFAGDWGSFTAGMILLTVLVSAVVYMLTESKARQIEAERRVTESQLQLLQAQIEPHFLFNTLANVLSLIETDAPRARRSLEAFTDYLRVSFTELRRADVTLQTELALASAYLQVLQLRMDDRLRFRIDADADARRALLPPLLVQPLVENAVQHGLEPKLEGGSIVLQARREGDRLVITVDDDGLGLDAVASRSVSGRGHGVALVNLRERVASRYGGAGRLTVEPLEPGVRSRLDLPWQPAAAHTGAVVNTAVS